MRTRGWFIAATLCTGTAFGISARPTGHLRYAPDAVPHGGTLTATYSEGWLPEPFQSGWLGAPAVGRPIADCASVVRLRLEPAGARLNSPVTVTFDCRADSAQAFAFVANRWVPVASEHDEEGRLSITVHEPTTYALLQANPATFL